MTGRKLTIAVDCDEVLIHTTEYMVGAYNQMFGTSVPLALAHTPNIPDWDAPREVVHERLDEIQRRPEYLDLHPSKVTINVVRQLAEQHDLHVVTARPESVMDTTRLMISRYFDGCFSSVKHVGQDGDKGAVCSALRADVLIDDSLRHLLRAQDCGVEHRLWFGDYIWQTEHPEADVVTCRCRNWNEVEAEIERIAAK